MYEFKTRKVIAIATILCFLTTSLIFLNISASSIDPYQNLRNTSPKIVYDKLNLGWWLDGYKDKEPDFLYRPVVNRLVKAVFDEGKFKSMYVYHFVNPHNNTIFVRLTDVSEENKSMILEDIKPPSGVTIIFLKGEVPYYQLETWVEQAIFLQQTRDVPFNGIAITVNGTLKFTLDSFTPKDIETLLNTVNIPPGILVISQEGEGTEDAYTDRIRPLEAGIKVQDSIGTSTINFPAKIVSTGQEGVLLAGHAIDVGQTAYQNVISGNNNIGQCTIDPAGPRYSDAAWVPLATGVDSISELYDPYNEFNVVGDMSYNQQTVGDIVEKIGITTGWTYGHVVDKRASTPSPSYGTLYNQMIADYTSASGDSGGPVFQIFHDGGIHTVLVFGIHSGTTSDGYKRYSPPDGIETDFGVQLNFAGAG